MVVSVGLLWLLALPAVSSASVRTECCFEVHAKGYGKVSLTWNNQQPPTPTPVHTGSEQFEWNWETTELDEYSESDGYPSLQRPELNLKEIPGLEQQTLSSAKSNERYWAPGVTTPDICNAMEETSDSLTESYFTRIEPLVDAPPPVQRRFKGHKYVLQLVSAGHLVGTMCFDGSDPADGLPSPPGANGLPNQEEQPEGPGGYYVTLPPRAYLRHRHGQPDYRDVEYTKNLSFSACAGAPATEPACDRYTLTESTTFRLHFTWFPEALLRHEAKALKRGAKPPK